MSAGQAGAPLTSRWTKRHGKPRRVGPKIILPVDLFDSLATAAEAAEGVRWGTWGNTKPEYGNPSGCLLGLAAWLDDGNPTGPTSKGLREAFKHASVEWPGTTNDAAFDEGERVLPFDVLCKRIGIDVEAATA